MRRKTLIINNISLLLFVLSSLSLLVIPFINQNNELTKAAYIDAGVFWIGLISGILLQISAAMISKKSENKRTYKERKMIIPIIVFTLVFVLIICFLKKNVLLTALDMGMLLFSIELYFYLKRGDSV